MTPEQRLATAWKHYANQQVDEPYRTIDYFIQQQIALAFEEGILFEQNNKSALSI